MRYLFSLFLLMCCLWACKEAPNTTIDTPDETTAQLGEVHFKVTGAAAAQEAFKKGLLLLHSFEYEDAREAFLETQAIDSTFAMAYWGEAMTHHHSLWQRQEQELALEALAKLAPTPEERVALAKTEMEKDFLQAVEILFGEGTKYERDLAYKDHMAKLKEKYPDQHEVSAFYAISLLGASRNGRDEALYDMSAKIAQGIMEENPNHPGALHYLIHSYDDPLHAHLATKAADSYAKVAPDAAHALHMPSHIYVGLGRWNDVVNSNIASWNASVKRMQEKELDKDARSYHALHWLQYGLLQRGEVEQAAELLKSMIQYGNDDDGKRARSYLIMMKGGQMIETNTWEGAFADIEVEVADLNIVSRAQNDFLNGMKAYHKGKRSDLEMVLKDMAQARSVAESIVGDSGFAMCSKGGFANRPPDQVDIDMAYIMEMELAAYLADLDSDTKAAINWFEKATALEEILTYSFGPPDVMKPVHEAYAEYLFAQNEAEKALLVFEKALEINPRRLLSLKGKKAAAEALENESVLAEVEQEIAVSIEAKPRAVVL